jgi:long-chain acyl-CoA synthetase
MTREPSAFARLVSHWTPGTAPERALAEETRGALLAVHPGDLAAIAELVTALDACLASPVTRGPARRALFGLVDAARRRRFTEAMAPADIEPWTRLMVSVIDRADHTLGDVLRSREETARGLLALSPDDPDLKVAILAENSLDTALADLACLSNGILDFPLPANSTPEQVSYMLRHSGARVLVVSDEEQLEKVLPALPGLPDLKEVVVVSRAAADRHGLLSLEQAVAQGAGAFDDADRALRAEGSAAATWPR